MRYLLTVTSCLLVLSLNAQDIYGCISPFAPNYNPAATINDYSCDYDVPQLLADGYCIQELLDGDVWYYDFQGIEYGGGYIRHVSPSAGKALISSGTNVGSFEWGCYGQSVSTSTGAWTGETNTLAIVSAGCTDVADAAIAAYQFSQNGYSDWFLPSSGDYGLGDCGSCGSWYSSAWSSSEYSLNLDRARKLSGSLDYRFNSNHVIPVRYIDLEDDCIGPASCQDWVQEGQGGPPPGVSCDYPLFNCESVDDPIWNDMATGLYPADTSYLEVGISSDASVLLHASETFTVDGTAQTLISLEIDSIADLPPGLTLDDPGLPLMLSPDEGAVSTSCFALEGVPSDQGTYTITVYSTATIAVFGFEIPVDGVQFDHTIEVLETTSEILGCTYADALNFNPYANSDDGSCEFEPFAGCESDADEDGVCDEDEVAGCTDFTACNFDDFSTDDDDSCFYEEFGYDCDGNCLEDADLDGICDAFEIEGCTDLDALNFDPTATDDDGSCAYCALEASLEVTDATCNGSDDGAVLVSAIGAYPNDSLLTFVLLPDGAPQSEGAFVGLLAGEYTVEVVDAAGCFTTVLFEVMEPEPLLVLLDNVVGTEQGLNQGAIAITVTGGSEAYVFAWTQLDGSFTSASEDIDNLEGGTYQVTVSDENGCSVTSFEIVVETIVGVEESMMIDLSLFPNPVVSNLTIEIGHHALQASVHIHDAAGRLVYTKTIAAGTNRLQVDCSRWMSGMYHVVVLSGEWDAREKVFVQR
ncbi:MAG TPA: hypothetical protein DCX00_05385 [Flavobacteriales bacterium]|nr:hypothetical protein [Flavobacteriales bacterium]